MQSQSVVVRPRTPAVHLVVVVGAESGCVVRPGRVVAGVGDQIQIWNRTDRDWEVLIPASHGLGGAYAEGGNPYVIDVTEATPKGSFPYQVYVREPRSGASGAFAHGESAPHVIIV